ncbi:MAG: hypothetical protein ABSG07_00080 [Terriglobales bacterium]|jgi:hypothetical protein
MESYNVSQLSTIIAAVGALGTAAFGLVDAFKALPGGGISSAGFTFIRQTILKLAPEVASLDGTGLSRDSILNTLQSQWINGTATTDQINIAKSLIKLRLTPETAAALASATGVDAAILSEIAASIRSGTALTPEQSDVYGRFDLLLTTLLDQAYQRADQRYRNWAKFAAVPIAVVLALIAARVAPDQIKPMQAVLLGLIATPIAPVAKDISSAIATAAQAVQSWGS